MPMPASFFWFFFCLFFWFSSSRLSFLGHLKLFVAATAPTNKSKKKRRRRKKSKQPAVMARKEKGGGTLLRMSLSHYIRLPLENLIAALIEEIDEEKDKLRFIDFARRCVDGCLGVYLYALLPLHECPQTGTYAYITTQWLACACPVLFFCFFKAPSFVSSSLHKPVEKAEKRIPALLQQCHHGSWPDRPRDCRRRRLVH